MSKKVKLLLFSVILFTIIYLSFQLRTDEANRIKHFGEQGIGTFSHYGLKTIDVSYSYQGNDYTYTQAIPFATLVEGEQYKITIYKKDPSRVLVHMDNPVMDTINYKWMTTRAIRIEQLQIDNAQWKFSYNVNQKSHRRIQKFDTIDTSMVVAYRADIPEIAYLVP